MAPGISRRSEVDRLIGDLESPESVRRDASVARLRVIGARALPRLIAFIESTAVPQARALAIAALDGINDPRASAIALRTLHATDVDAVIAALGVLRNWVAEESGTTLLEAVTAIAVDRTRDARVRVAALEALSDLPEDLVRPIREQAPPPETGGPAVDNPVAAREWIEAHGVNATLATLHDAIETFRSSEQRAETSRARQEWVSARGAAHRILAARGSRLGLYDARDTIGSAAAPLPPGFVEAIESVGDASCLEPLAHAWSASQHAAWRARLSEAARRIMTRSKLGGRNAVVKNIRATWSGFI